MRYCLKRWRGQWRWGIGDFEAQHLAKKLGVLGRLGGVLEGALGRKIDQRRLDALNPPKFEAPFWYAWFSPLDPLGFLLYFLCVSFVYTEK